MSTVIDGSCFTIATGHFSFLNVCRLLNLVPENIAAELIADVSLGMFSQCEFPR